MSQAQPNPSPMPDVDNIYRRISAADPSRPSEWVRRKVTAHAAQLGAERAIKQSPGTRAPKVESARPDGAAVEEKQSPSRVPLFATVGVVAVVAIAAGWHFLGSRSAPATTALSSSMPSPAAVPDTNTPEAAQEPAPETNTSAPPAPVQSPPPAMASATPQSTPTAAEPKTSPTSAPAPAPRSAQIARQSLTQHPSAAQAPAATASASTRDQANSRVASTSARVQNSAGTAVPRGASGSSSTSPADTPGASPATSVPRNDTQVAAAATAAATPAVATPPVTPAASTAASPPSSAAATAASPAASASTVESLLQAATAGDIAGVQAAIDQHINVNARDSAGRTALMLATVNGREDVAKALLAHHADPNIADARGVTPLRASFTHRQGKISVILQAAGAR
jgi:hypothetical protein